MPSSAEVRSTIAWRLGKLAAGSTRTLLPRSRPREIETNTMPPTTSKTTSETVTLWKISPISPMTNGAKSQAQHEGRPFAGRAEGVRPRKEVGPGRLGVHFPSSFTSRG